MLVFDVWASSSSPGYLCPKFCFFRSLHCWASPWRKSRIQSVTQSLTQLIWCPGNQSSCFGKICTRKILIFTLYWLAKVCEDSMNIPRWSNAAVCIHAYRMPEKVRDIWVVGKTRATQQSHWQTPNCYRKDLRSTWRRDKSRIYRLFKFTHTQILINSVFKRGDWTNAVICLLLVLANTGQWN